MLKKEKEPKRKKLRSFPSSLYVINFVKNFSEVFQKETSLAKVYEIF